MTLQLVAVLVLGLMCGSELNVAAFAHPTLNRQPLEAHILVRSSAAALFARVMPFWMVGSTLLNLALLLPFEPLGNQAWRLAAWLARPRSSRFCSHSSGHPLTAGLPNGRRILCLTTGKYRSIAGTCTIG